MTIGELSRQSGVPIETIRYYERIGLLPAPPRRPTRFRDFDEGAAERLRFVRRAQALGFSLREVGRLLALRDAPDGTAAVHALAEAHLAALADRIRSLTAMRDALAPLVAACPAEGPVGDCPILATLDGEAAPGGNSGVRSRAS